MGPSRQNTQVTQTGQGSIARPTPVTPDDEHTDDRTLSSASSQENLPTLSSSTQQQQPPIASPLQSSPVASHSTHSSNYQASSPTLLSQTVQLDPSSSYLPSLPSSYLPSQLTGTSSPPFPVVHSSSIQSPPFPAQPGPYQQISSISREERQELAYQDSANNNVDENSNDQQYDRYVNYPQDYPVQYTPDPSVRPRVRPRPFREEEPDCAPRMRPDIEQRGNSEGEGYRYSHRRNMSDGHPCTSRGYRRDSISDYPPLPNSDTSLSESPLPRVPNLHPRHGREEWVREHSQWAPAQRWLPMRFRGGGYGPPPNQEDTTRGARELLINFTTDALHSHQLNVPQDIRDQIGFSNPTFSMAGRELKTLADNFATTEERRRVREMAECVNMSSMTMENFFHLCAELFSDGITRERIVALFTFVGDVAIHQVQHRGGQFLGILLEWSLKYLVDHVCRWVQEAGGWMTVLSQGVNLLYQTAVFTFCACGTIAACLFIYKTLKDW
ncbi:hypothetical protein Pmani_009129 [Petrolisthes manimaculis]|uniref:Bcl-2 Bcl-2 homology region 1-3 domain-containing protein n=1 Tax=Petrolisthes manimaculis TaxID=1843537 RepID=A0AAE1UI83_9EUCA|nr:hypothetical protein Pmani_009129 [Petrolisthes manimaculis]